jgi:hypothetical protein
MKNADINWKEEWKGMPEFKAEKIVPFRKVVVHFYDQAGVDAFEELIGKKIGKQPSIGFPERVVRKYSDKRYFEEAK